MKKIYILISILLAGFSFVSCESELDIPKKGNLGGEDDFYKTEEDALQASAAMYSDLSGLRYNLFGIPTLLSDDCWAGGGNLGDNADFQNLNAYKFGSSNSTIESLYTGLYSLVYDANLIIQRFDGENAASGIRRSIAEAYFFRGFAHFYLGLYWGMPPVVDHLLEPSEYAKGNSAPGECYAQAINDIRHAIDMNALPSKESVSDAVTGIRVTKETAYAYLGKALLFAGEHQEAVKAFDAVVDSRLYDLYKGDFGDIMKSVADMCCESILEAVVVNDPNNFVWNWEMVMGGWRNDCLNFNGMKPEWRAYLHPHGGYGFFNPRKSLYDAFVEMEGKDGYRLNQSIKTYAFLKNEIGINVTKNMPGQEGFFSWKNRIIDDEVTACWGEMDVQNNSNPRFMRYAEVLLLAAEANLLAGTGKAAQYINPVRERAGLAPLSSVTMDDIKKEKRLELAGEGIRFHDLVRWGDAPRYLADQGKQIIMFTTSETTTVCQDNPSSGFVAGKHELLPIPEKEMILNPNMVQNPGWAGSSEE